MMITDIKEKNTKNNATVSVVMPAYNCEKYISKAIESVIAQTYTMWSLIVVDDCSTDNTLLIAKSYERIDSRIKVFKNGQNQGVARTRNFGIAQAVGDYIALLDSDDVWKNTKLEKQMELIEKCGADIVYCSYGFIDENDEQIRVPFIVPESTSFNKMLRRSVISCSTALVKEYLLKEHIFKHEYYHEDYVLWMELLSIPVTAVGDTEVLAYYRQLTGSRSYNKLKAAAYRWRIYRDALNLGIVESVVAFAAYVVNGVIKYRK